MPELPLTPVTNAEAILFTHAVDAPGAAEHLGRTFDPQLVQEAGALAFAWHKYFESQRCPTEFPQSVSATLSPDCNQYDLSDATLPPDALDRDELKELFESPRPDDLSPLHGLVVLDALRMLVSPNGRTVTMSHMGHQAADFLATSSPDKDERLFYETMILPLMEQDARDSSLIQ